MGLDQESDLGNSTLRRRDILRAFSGNESGPRKFIPVGVKIPRNHLLLKVKANLHFSLNWRLNGL